MFIILSLRLRCGAHLIHQPIADNVVEPLREGLIAFMSAYRVAMTKNINTQNYFTNLMKKIQYKNKQQNKKRARLHARKRRSGTNLSKIVKYKSPSPSKLNNLTG